MRTFRTAALAFVGLWLLPAVGEARQVPGTIRSGITVVPVDVRVLDRDGRPITDLTQADFTIFEDGMPQVIRQFTAHALTPEAPVPGLRPAMRSSPGSDAGPIKHRTFLIVLGRGRLQHPAKGVDALITFVRERLLPQDQVAVLAYNRATDFTTDHASIAALLERFRSEHEGIESKLFHGFSDLQGLFGSKKIPPKAQAQIDRVFDGGGSVASRTVPPGRVTDAGRIAEDARLATETMLGGDLTASGERAPGSDMSLNEHIGATVQTTSDLVNLYTGIEYLRYIEGEKHLLFVTERGLFLPRVEDDMSLGAMANDARVVLDTIQTGGVSGGPPPSRGNRAPMPGPSFTETFALQSLRTLSQLTGGHGSIYAYADEAMQQIDRGSRFHYLLGYSSSNGNWDERYRRIKVQINRPGATAHYRQGYYARQQLVPYDRREFLTYSRVLAAALYPQEINDIQLRLKADLTRGEGGSGEIIAEIRIDLKRVGFVEKNGRQTAQLDISIYTAKSDGRGVGEMYRKFDLSLTPEEHKKALKDGVSYTMRLATRGSAQLVKVVVYDYTADVIGTAETKVY
jgi:VWFA-related protein